MKILHVCQYYNDGYGYQENLLPRAQANLGHDVVVVTSPKGSLFKGQKNSKRYGIGCFKDDGISIMRIDIHLELKGKFVFFKKLYDCIKEVGPDLIFHHGLNSPSLFTVAKYKRDNKEVHLVGDNHADVYNSGKNLVWRKLYYELLWASLWNKCLANCFDVVYGVSPGRCEFANKLLGINKSQISLLPLGSGYNSSEIDSLRVLSRNKCSNVLKIVTGGKITHDKNIASLIKAISNKNVLLTIFGVIEDAEVAKLVDENQNVYFVGWKNRNGIYKELQKADIGCWPGLHTALIEDAIGVGLPIVTMFNGNTSHLIENNGIYLFSGMPEEISQVIKVLSENESLRTSLKVAATRTKSKFDYGNIAKQITEDLKLD